MREKTGYYDRHGKEIRDGDRLMAIVNGRIVYGEVEEFNDDWLMKRSTWSPFLGDLDDIEILEEE